MFEPTELMLDLAESAITELNIKEKDQEDLFSQYDEYMNPENYTTVTAVFYGEPKAQPRARVNSNLNHFYDPAKSFKLTLCEAIASQMGKTFRPINSEIYFEARFYKPFPKSTGKKNQVLMELGAIRPVGKPDLDNYEKLLYDSLLHVLYVDDAVIVSGNHQKFYSIKPRVEVEIRFRKK